ncbi:hypothetical protein V492_04539 [Pseudogymnoascus sp. VKM F-4246]|nr:hypothetical protein V492_04539 [Pseudogymnoascus sp. VKM F-4246]
MPRRPPPAARHGAARRSAASSSSWRGVEGRLAPREACRHGSDNPLDNGLQLGTESYGGQRQRVPLALAPLDDQLRGRPAAVRLACCLPRGVPVPQRPEVLRPARPPHEGVFAIRGSAGRPSAVRRPLRAARLSWRCGWCRHRCGLDPPPDPHGAVDVVEVGLGREQGVAAQPVLEAQVVPPDVVRHGNPALAAEVAAVALVDVVEVKAVVLGRAVGLASGILPPAVLEGGDDVWPGQGQPGGGLGAGNAVAALEMAVEERVAAVDALLGITAGLGVGVDGDDMAAGGAEHEGAVGVVDDLEEVNVGVHAGSSSTAGRLMAGSS